MNEIQKAVLVLKYIKFCLVCKNKKCTIVKEKWREQKIFNFRTSNTTKLSDFNSVHKKEVTFYKYRCFI